MNVLCREKFQKAIKLSDAHPFEQINMLLEHRIGLTDESSRDYSFDATVSRCVCEQPRINTISGDDS